MELNNWKVTVSIGNKLFPNEVVGPYTLYEAFDLYIEGMKHNNAPKGTIKNYTYVRDKHLTDIMLKPIRHLSADDILMSFDKELELGYKPNTVKTYRSMVKKVLSAYYPTFTLTF